MTGCILFIINPASLLRYLALFNPAGGRLSRVIPPGRLSPRFNFMTRLLHFLVYYVCHKSFHFLQRSNNVPVVDSNAFKRPSHDTESWLNPIEVIASSHRTWPISPELADIIWTMTQWFHFLCEGLFRLTLLPDNNSYRRVNKEAYYIDPNHVIMVELIIMWNSYFLILFW